MTPIFAAWAILATVGAVVVYILMRRENREQYQRAEKLAGELAASKASKRIFQEQCAHLLVTRGEYMVRAADLEHRLRQIEQQRHLSAKRARAAQIAQQRAARDAKTAELRAEIAGDMEQRRAA